MNDMYDMYDMNGMICMKPPPTKQMLDFPFSHGAESDLRVEEKIHLIHFVLLCISQCGASGHYGTIRTADHQGVALCESRG